MQQRILIGLAALGVVAIAIGFVVRPTPCTGNYLQDKLSCVMIGDQK